MRTRFLLITAFLFCTAWRRTDESLLLFGALFSIGLSACVFIYRQENITGTADNDD